MDMNSAVDVRDVLGAVRVPTLVLHRTGDALFKVEEARYLADHIPSARLQLLEGSDHLVCGDPDQILDQIDAFLQTLRPPAPQPLSLAAVVAVAGESEMQVIDDLVATGGRARATPSGRRVALFEGRRRPYDGLASLPAAPAWVCRSPRWRGTRCQRRVLACATQSESPMPLVRASCGCPLRPECCLRAAGFGCCRYRPRTIFPGSNCFALSGDAQAAARLEPSPYLSYHHRHFVAAMTRKPFIATPPVSTGGTSRKFSGRTRRPTSDRQEWRTRLRRGVTGCPCCGRSP